MSMQADGFEQRLQHVYSGWLRDGDTVIDVGAHTGRHAVPMAACVGQTGQVRAFEPNPRIFPLLQRRVSALGLSNVSMQDLALSDSAGEAEFVIAIDRIEESGLRERQYDSATRLEHVQVKLVKLDDIAPESVRFIKIDTEGAEFNVILGAKETIARLRPVVSFEFGENSYRAYGVDPGAVHRFFGQLNYGIFSIFGDTLDEKTFVRHSREQLYWDYIACPSVHRAAMQSIMRSYRSRA
jgi:FkbM family methyltransferase